MPGVGHVALPVSAEQTGRPLLPVPGWTRQRFVSAVRGALVKAGIQAQLYAGHSFQIGATTTAGRRCDLYPVQLVSGATFTMLSQCKVCVMW